MKVELATAHQVQAGLYQSTRHYGTADGWSLWMTLKYQGYAYAQALSVITLEVLAQIEGT